MLPDLCSETGSAAAAAADDEFEVFFESLVVVVFAASFLVDFFEDMLVVGGCDADGAGRRSAALRRLKNISVVCGIICLCSANSKMQEKYSK